MTKISLEMFAKVPRASLSMDNFATMFNLSCKQTNGEYVQNFKVYISYILQRQKFGHSYRVHLYIHCA